jgi:hypothetical protein
MQRLINQPATRRGGEGPVSPCTGSTWSISRPGSSVNGVDRRKDVHDFLTSRRAQITPEHAELPTYGDRRRAPGLRLEEAASLAG